MLNRLSHPGATWFHFLYHLVCSFFKIFLTFIYFWETDHEGGRDRERRGGHRIQSRLQDLSCQQSPDSWTMRSWPEPKPDVQPTEPPRRPLSCMLFNHSIASCYPFPFPCSLVILEVLLNLSIPLIVTFFPSTDDPIPTSLPSFLICQLFLPLKCFISCQMFYFLPQ